MIQRLQTVYFIAIILICAMTCGGSLINFHQMNEGLVKDYIMNMIYLRSYENGILVSQTILWELIALVSVTIGWTVNIILGFKNRTRQILHTKINFLLIALLIVALVVKAFTSIPDYSFGTLSMQSTFGLALLFFMLYLNLRALLLIRKDDALVKSADRIR
jgi:glucan phosphoethanolaminetransferase (alkaline phosphatase superfamily)